MDDWRAIYGITYSVEGVGKRGPLKAKSLNNRPHTDIKRQRTQTHTRRYTHRDTHIGSGLGWGIMEA